MVFLCVGSTGDNAGHTLLTWAIGRRLVERGLNVGFLKPFGTNPVNINGLWIDRDAFLFKEVLNLQEPFNRICPYMVSEEAWRQKENKEILKEIRSLSQELSLGKDILLIMGSENIFFDDASRSVSDISLIGGLKSDFVLINRYRNTPKSVYSILSVSSLLKDRVKGIVLNRVPLEKFIEIKSRIIPSLEQKGISIIATIPEDPALSFRSFKEIKEVLDGELLLGEGNLEQPVGGMTVGSSDLKGELKIFKRVYNKIILQSPVSAGAEIKGPAHPRAVVGIILTGGRNPAPQVVLAAKKANIPLMIVKDDAFAALELLEQKTPVLSPGDEAKVRLFSELLDREGALDTLLQSIGLDAR